MKKISALRYLVATALGLVVFFAIAATRQWLANTTLGGLDTTPPLWASVLRDPLFALSQTVPAFVAGLVARNLGAFVGAAIGALSWLLADLTFGQTLLHYSSAPGLLRNLAGATLATSLVGAFAGAAGVACRTRPNNSFKPSPLRGPA